MSEVRIVDLEKLGVDIDTFNKIYSIGEEDGRADAEEEVENRYNRVLDDEKRLSYEQGRADAIEEFEKTKNEVLKWLIKRQEEGYGTSNGELLDHIYDIAEQLKEQKNVRLP